MKSVTLNSSGKSQVEAFTDCYAEQHGIVILLSIVGNDSVVKALSATLLDKSKRSDANLYVHDEKKRRSRRTSLYRDSRAELKVRTAKLQPGVTHQLIYDVRFVRANEKDEGTYYEGMRHVLVKPGEDAADLVYQSVLKHLPTPTLPEWSHAIYEEIRAQSKVSWRPMAGQIRDIDTYPKEFKVLSVQVSEAGLDAVVSDLVKRGVIGWE